MNDQAVPTLLTVKQFSEKHPAFSVGSLRWLIFKAGCPEYDSDFKRNSSLNSALVRVGRRVLINERLFFEWLLNNQDWLGAENE